jgi:hypothetical protein
LENGNFHNICDVNNFEKFILLLSCAAHDIAHPGTNNIFEVNTKSELSTLYNDKAVLENYSLFVFFNLIKDINLNIFSEFDPIEYKNIRRVIILNIIATDMSNHFTDLKKFKEIVYNEKCDLKKKENKEFILTQVIHSADISNSFKPFNISKTWVDLLFKEFYNQVIR